MPGIEEVELLLVEDNPHDAELTIRGLKKAGLANKLFWVKDGEEALDYLFMRGVFARRDPALPKLVLLDLKMPKIDGIEVLKVVKADDRTRRIPVVVMTSSQEECDLAASYDLGVNSYIVKPVDFATVAEVVRQAGYYWLAINRTPTP
jgi:two-component system response regulator